MWVLTMFDLPVGTKLQRRNYALFRKSLLKGGFLKMQFSVYARFCFSRENSEVHVRRIQKHLPPDGEVRILVVTDKQLERMLIFWGKRRRPTERTPSQLLLF